MRFVFLALALAAAAPAFASQELAQKNACLACHGIDRKLVGPAFQDVAKNYAGQPDAAVAAEFNRVLLDYLRTGTEPDKYEAASAVAIRGGREDLPLLEQLLSDPMPDARIGAAHAILRITQATGSRTQILPATTAPAE